MAMPGFIVDGYNLLHCFRDLGRMMGRDPERARGELVRRLGVFRGRKRIRVWVVFDGRGDEDELKRAGAFGVRVFFSGQMSADHRIIQLLKQQKNPRAWTVVSSDREVQFRARGAGGEVSGSGRFADLVKAADDRPQREPDKPEMTASDVAEWEDYFRKKS
jgi:predicted RNA-binding protein with PIN domain